jgi:hypothetical protein
MQETEKGKRCSHGTAMTSLLVVYLSRTDFDNEDVLLMVCYAIAGLDCLLPNMS